MHAKGQTASTTRMDEQVDAPAAEPPALSSIHVRNLAFTLLAAAVVILLLRFMQPVRAGDTVTAHVSIRDINVEKRRITMDTACRVGGKDVLIGEALIMVNRKPA